MNMGLLSWGMVHYLFSCDFLAPSSFLNGFLKVFLVSSLGLAAMMLQDQGLRAATSSKIAEGQDYFQMVPSKFTL